jgi:hypothetical protein
MKKFILLLLIVTHALWGRSYEPKVLEDILVRVDQSAQAGEKPVLVFDLDDTLINASARTQLILKEMTGSSPFKELFPFEVGALRSLSVADIQYRLQDTLKGLGITKSQFIDHAVQYWEPRFFSNSYAAQDLAILDSVRYVNEAHNLGATIVYLTGRDAPRMELGTTFNLRSLGFPIDDSSSVLMMKPNLKIEDLEFKNQALAKINQLGTVLAGYENEPANINAFKHAWPEAQMVFLDTIHSPTPISPEKGITWIRDFNY